MTARDATFIDKYVGTKIRTRREELGYSQELLSQNLGVSFQQVQKYERGVNRISASRLFSLSRILEVTPEYFFEGLLPVPTKSKDKDAEVIEPIKVAELLSDTAAVTLLELFAKIESPNKRKKILELTKIIADE